MNIPDRLRRSAQRLPDKPALLFRDETLTYAELDARIDRGAAALQSRGLEPGDRIAVLLPNSTQFVESFYAALRAGLVAVPVNVQFTPEEVCHVLADAGARAAVVDEGFLPILEPARAQLPDLETVIVAGAASAPEGLSLWRDLRDAAQDAPTPVPLGQEDLAILQYTSGTTGRPKGAMLTHGHLLANHEQMAQTTMSVQERDVVLCVLPLFHIYALNVAMAFTLSRGATVLLVERFDPLATIREVERQRASIIVGAPPMFVAWNNTVGITDLDLGSVRFAVSGAAPLPAAVLTRFMDVLDIPIYEGYGLTETAPVLTTTAMDREVRPGSVGKPLPGVELRLIDEQGDPVRRGDPGEVIVRGPNVFSGYWQQPEATAEVLDADGWFHTGDIGYADDGNIYLVDRKKDLIIVSGFNVYPREVEDVLMRNPKVAHAAAVGTAHPYTGEAVKAIVVLMDGAEASADELIDHCKRSLARFKCPEVIDFAAELPLLPNGKVRRRELRESA